MSKRKHKINEKVIAAFILIVALLFSFLIFSQVSGLTSFAIYSVYPEEPSAEILIEEPAPQYHQQQDYGIMAVPSNATVTLNATDHPLNRTTANLTCYANASDADGDNITYNGFWYKDGVQQHYVWNVTAGGADDDNVYGVAVDSQDNIIITGYVLATDYYIWTIKYNSSGSELWNITTTGGKDNGESRGVAVDSQDNIIITGATYETGKTPNFELLIIKYNSSGSQLWNTTAGGANDEKAHGVAVDSQDNIIVTGNIDSGADDDAWTIKYNSSGSPLWNVTEENYDAASGSGIAVDSQDNIIVTGTMVTDLNYDAWIIKYNSSGSELWNISINGTNSDGLYGVAVDSQDNIIVTGTSDLSEAWTIKYNSSGSELWNTTADGEHQDYGAGLITDSQDNIIITGYSSQIGGDAWIIKYNSSGSHLWNTTAGGANDDYSQDIALDSKDNIILGGYTESFGAGAEDYWTIKYYGFTLENQTQNISILVDTLDSSYTAKGETWHCDVRTYDGGNYSSYNSSNNLTILNTLPSNATVTLNATDNPLNRTTANLTCYANASDADLDNITYNGFWYKNGVEQHYVWNVRSGPTCDYLIYEVAIDSSDNIITAGEAYEDMWIVKHYPNGTEIWNTSADGGGNEYADGLGIDSSDNIIITGTTNSFGASYDFWTIKYYPNGTEIWNVTAGADASDFGRGIAIDSSDNIIVAGTKTNNDFWMIKYYPNGTEIWNVTIDNGNNDNCRDVAVDSSDNIILFGYTNPSGTNYEFWTIKFYQNGTQIWNVTAGGTGHDYGYGVATDSLDNIIVTGYIEPSGNHDFWSIKYYPNGTEIWNVTLDGGTENDEAYGIAIDSSDNIIVAGKKDYYGWAVKYHSNGTEIWNRTITMKYVYYSVAVDSFDNILLTGMGSLPGAWTLKYYGFSLENQTKGQQVLVDTLNSSYTAKDETWHCDVRTYDRESYSDYNNSNNLTILNTPPTQSTPILNATDNPLNRTTANLTCHNQSTTDDDSDSVKNIYNWYKNNKSIMILNMPFEGGSTSGTASANGLTKDYSSYSNNGTVVNATWNSTGGYDGKGAYEFDGINNYIDLGSGSNKISSTSNYTLSAWIKTSDVEGTIVGAFDDYPMPQGYRLRITGGNISLINDLGSGVAGPFVNDSQWHHIVGVKIGAESRIYVDGEYKNNGSAIILSPQNTVYIGAYWGSALKPAMAGLTNFFNGTIDEVRIYNYSLSAEQIKALFENRTSTIVSNETRKGDSWHCELTPNDGTEDGTTKNSPTLTILNSPPVNNASIPNQTWNEDTENNNAFDLDNYFTDADNDNLTYNYTQTGGTDITVSIAADNNVSFSQPANWYGIEYVVFNAIDGTDTTQSNNVTLKVNDVAEAAGGGGAATRPSCISSWECTAWSECAEGIQYRTCSDKNKCRSPTQENRTCFIPSCTDRIQNQGETGIDCGGPCEPCAPAIDKEEPIGKILEELTGESIEDMPAGFFSEFWKLVKLFIEILKYLQLSANGIEITGFAAYSIYPEELSAEMPAEIPIGEPASQYQQQNYGIMAVPSNATLLLNATDHPLNRTTANLTCYANASDADGDDITYNGFWYKDGVEQFYIWNTTTGTAGDDELSNAVAIDSSDNIIVTGYTDSSGSYDFWTIKYNSSGTQLWNKTIGTANQDYAQSVAVDSSDNIIVTGSIDTGGVVYDFWTIKYNSSGTQLWNTTIGTANNDDYAYGIAVDSSDNILVAGYTNGSGNYDFWTIKYNSSGTQLWNTTTGTANKDHAYGIAVDSSDNILVAGYTNGSGNYDFWTIKYNSSGTQLWNTTTGTANDDTGIAVAVDSSDNIIVTGCSDMGGLIHDFWTIKYNSSGSQLWNKTISIANDDCSTAVAIDSSDNIIVTGYTDVNDDFIYDFWTIKYNSSGSQLWNKTIGTANDDGAYGIVIDSSDNIIVSGDSDFDGGFIYNFWTVKYYGFKVINQTQGQLVLVDTMDSSYTAKDETWHCDVRTYDGGNYSDYNSSNNLTILNSPPIQSTPFLNATDNPLNRTTANLTCYANASDADGDNITYNGFWYKDGVEQHYVWNVTANNDYYEYAYAVAVDSQDNIIVTGQDLYDIWTIKYNSSGSHIWNTTTISSTASDYANDVAVDSQDNIILTGTKSQSDFIALTQWWTIKLNSSGSELWNVTFGDGNQPDDAKSVAVDSQDNIIVTGVVNSGNPDTWVIKYNSSGTHLCNTSETGANSETGYGVAVDSQDNIIVASYLYSTNGQLKLIKYNSSCSELWNDLVGGTGIELMSGVAVDSQDNIIVAGYTDSIGAGNDDVWVIKYNSSGSELWNITIGGSSDDNGRDVAIDSQDNILITAVTKSFGAGDGDMWVIKLNSSGAHLWNTTKGGTGYDEGQGVISDSHDDIITVGYTESFAVEGMDDFWTVKHYGFKLENQTQNQQVLVDTLASSYTAKDETWHCDVRTYDGESYSGYNSSNNLTIQNTPPSQSTPILNATDNPLNRTTANLTCYNQSTADDDSDSVKNIYNWYKNNVSIMVLNMPFEGGSNSTYTKDYSGFGNDGTVSSATYNSSGGYDGKGAYYFDGINNYIDVGDVTFLDTANFTITTWIKSNDSSNYGVVVGKRDNIGVGFLLMIYNDGRVYGYMNDGLPVNAYSTATILDNNWHHVVMVVDRYSEVQVYVNGEADGSDSTHDGSVSLDNAVSLDIGKGRSNSFYFNGTIDEVRIYNISLSAEQIKALYENKTSTIVSNETRKGDSWHCDITPNDGAEDGTTKNSSSLTILNSPPVSTTIPNQTWNEDTANNNAFNLDDYFTDADSDNLTYNYTQTGGTNITISIAADNNVSFSQPADWYGTEYVVFNATDGTDTTQSNNVTLKVNDVAEPAVGGGGAATRPSCISFWECTAWTECDDGIQYRTCSDKNKCKSPTQENRTCFIPSCTDGIQNQGETGIDCGGPCEPCAPAIDQEEPIEEPIREPIKEMPTRLLSKFWTLIKLFIEMFKYLLSS